MKKKITFEIESEADNDKIISSLICWMIDNFRLNNKPEVNIEDIE
jgi:hypothetical protein